MQVTTPDYCIKWYQQPFHHGSTSMIKKLKRSVAIASGKGGVGKTTFSINLAISLAQAGNRVLYFDGDLGLANAQIGFNCQADKNFGHVLSGESAIEDILVDTGHGVTLVPGASGEGELAALDYFRSSTVVQAFSQLEDQFDYLLVDCAAGISPTVMAFLKGCQQRIIVGTQDMTSVADAYATIKVMVKEQNLRNIFFVPNCVNDEKSGLALFNSVDTVVRKFLFAELGYLGSVQMDRAVNSSWRRGSPIVKLAPHSQIAINYRNIANSLLATQPTLELDGSASQFFPHGIEKG